MAPVWLWKGVSRERSEELVTEAGLTDGRYLVRSREGANKGEYVLCVAYKGKPTHHLIKRNEEGVYVVNKKTFGGHAKIAQLIKVLKTKVAGWPVALTLPVPNPENAKADGDSPKKDANGGGSGGGGGGGGGRSYMGGQISRVEAESAVGEGGLADGNFILRGRSPEKPDDYVLCVVYKGKATHHLMTKTEEGLYTVNKKGYGSHTTVESLVKQLGVKQAGWPVPLTNPKGPAGGKGNDSADKGDDSAEKEAAAQKQREEDEAAAEKRAQQQEEARRQAEDNNRAVAPVVVTPPVMQMRQSSVTESSSDSSAMTLTLARAVINLGNRVDSAESKLKSLEELLARLESA